LTGHRSPARVEDSEVEPAVPLYEYQCARCGRFEVIRRFSDAALTKCPTCNGDIQKLFSAPAIQFKGSGWYVTDYARKSGAGGSEAASGEGKKAEPASASTSKDAPSATSPSPSAKKDGSGSGGTPASQ
jgi:putative FmdB family regulatory protein